MQWIPYKKKKCTADDHRLLISKVVTVHESKVLIIYALAGQRSVWMMLD